MLFTVAASLVVALTITPFLASRLLREHEAQEGNWLLQKVMAGIEAFYRPLLRASLAAPRVTLLVATGLFIASLMLIPRLGFSLFPPAEIPEVLVNIELPDGAAMSETGRVLNQVEKIVSASKDKGDVRWLMSNLGHGNPQVFYNVRPEQEKANHASVFVGLKEWNSRESVKLMDSWRAQIAKITGAQIIVIVGENGPPIKAPNGGRSVSCLAPAPGQSGFDGLLDLGRALDGGELLEGLHFRGRFGLAGQHGAELIDRQDVLVCGHVWGVLSN